MSSLSYIPFAYLHVTDEFILAVLLAHEYQIPITSTILDIFIATSSCQIKKKMKKKYMLIHWMAMRVNAHVVNQWRRLLKVKELFLHLCQKQKTNGAFIYNWMGVSLISNSTALYIYLALSEMRCRDLSPYRITRLSRCRVISPFCARSLRTPRPRILRDQCMALHAEQIHVKTVIRCAAEKK